MTYTPRRVAGITAVLVAVAAIVLVIVVVRGQQAIPAPTSAASAGDTSAVAATAAPSGRSSAPSATELPGETPSAVRSPTPSSSSTAVLVGAGDIATCRRAETETAALLNRTGGTIFTAGDNAYDDGTAAEFADCFDPSWGRYKGRIHPAPGNHEYHTRNAAGYYGYFGAAAGAEGGYYAYDLGSWHIYSLNSEVISDGELSWLRGDLESNPRPCVLAYWHHPRFSSGQHGNDGSVAPLWEILAANDADVVVNGHDHDYERFAPQTPTGKASATGIREFVVGTGGAALRPFDSPVANSEVRNAKTNGVIEFTLSSGSYAWEFVPVAGGSFRDAGSGTCH